MSDLKEGGFISFGIAVLSVIFAATLDGIEQLGFCIVSQVWCAAGVVLHCISKSKESEKEKLL